MKGYALIELMIAVGIMGILASVAIPMYGDYITRAQSVEEHMLSRTDKIDCALDPSLDKCPPTPEEIAAEATRLEADLKRWAKEREELTECCIQRHWKYGESVMDRYYRYKESGCHMETDTVPGPGAGLCPSLFKETEGRIGRDAWRDRLGKYITS